MASLSLYQQSEVFRKKLLPMWFTKKFNILTDFLEKSGEVERVGERDFKIPVQTTFGGRYGAYDPQYGDQGRGSGPTGIQLIQSYFNTRMNFEFSHLEIKATAPRQGVAVKSPFLQCVADGMREMKLIWDKVIHNDGTAAVGYSSTYSTVTGNSVYGFPYVQGAASNFGVQLLRRGQYYCIYDSTLTQLKSAGLLQAVNFNTSANTIGLNGIVPNGAAGDIFCFEGVSGPNPAGPRGLRYWLNQATSGFTAGVNRAVENQIIAKSVDGTNGLSTETVLAMRDKILLDRGEMANGILGIVHPCQRSYVYAQMQAIQMTLITADAPTVDRLPKIKGKETFMWGGVPHFVDIHQDRSTAHYIIPGDWGRAQLAPPGFFETPGKKGEDARFFQMIGGSGAPANAVWFGLTIDEDLYCTDPGSQGVIYNLPVAQAYV